MNRIDSVSTKQPALNESQISASFAPSTLRWCIIRNTFHSPPDHADETPHKAKAEAEAAECGGA
jgi:hypothetical protein